jgi:hypothetical protein
MLVEALFVMVFSGGSGNAEIGSRTVQVVSSMDKCYAVRDAFISTLKEPSVKRISDKRWLVEDEIPGFNDDYKLDCVPLIDSSQEN